MGKVKTIKYRRVSAVIMAIAMIISVIPFPQGLFIITANASQKMTATWTYTDTMKNSNGEVVTKLQGSGQTGTLTNTDGDVLQLDGSNGKIQQRTPDNNDFQVNGGTYFEVPVISGAKSAKITFTLRSGAWTNEDITVTGATDSQVSISNTSITVNCTLDGKTDNVGITMAYTGSKYVQTITAESSTSLAVTEASFAGDNTSAEWTYNNGTVKASNSTSSIQKVTGTYTNTDGDVL